MIIDSVALTHADICTQILPSLRSAVVESHSAVKILTDKASHAAASRKPPPKSVKLKEKEMKVEKEESDDLQVFLDMGGIEEETLLYFGEGFREGNRSMSKFSLSI